MLSPHLTAGSNKVSKKAWIDQHLSVSVLYEFWLVVFTSVPSYELDDIEEEQEEEAGEDNFSCSDYTDEEEDIEEHLQQNETTPGQ